MAAVDPVFGAANALREQLLAGEIGQRLTDPTGRQLDDALIDWNLEESRDHRWALEHVLTRRPRKRGSDARWRVVMRQSTQQGFYRWIKHSVQGAARDLQKPGRPVPDSARAPRSEAAQQEVEWVALMERAELTQQRQQVVLAVVEEGSVAAAARRLGIARTTASTHLTRAKKKLRPALRAV